MNIFNAKEWSYKTPYGQGDVVYIVNGRGNMYFMAMKDNIGYFPTAGTTWMLIHAPDWDLF